jgi:adenosylcobyric acid synthase
VQEIEGLGLINSITTIAERKKTLQAIGKIDFDYFGQKVEGEFSGYEIHMGITEIYEEIEHMLILDTGEKEGAVKDGGLIAGTYIHGIFDSEEPRKTILETIRKSKGIYNENKYEDFTKFKERQYSQLGDILEKSLNINKIIEIMKG